MSYSYASNSNLRGAQRGAAQSTATSSFVGVVRVDGTTMLVDANGTISVNQTALNTLSSNTWRAATSSTLGLVKPDGTSVLINAGVISIQAFYTGMIMMWSGSIATIPTGWALCNGSNGTPDLRNRFVVAAGSTYNPGDTGGTSDAIVVSHNHTITDPGHFHSYGGGTQVQAGADNSGPVVVGTSAYNTGSKVTGISIDTAGQSGTNQNLPPYYALAYIMKL